jgi:hypothetical protein
MGTYSLSASKYPMFQIFGFNVFVLALFSFLLISTIHEIGHYVAVKIRNYPALSILVWLYLLPVGVNHPPWRSRADKIILCLSGPLMGVFGSLVFGYILFLSIPMAWPLIIVMFLSAIALGYKDYRELL